MGAINRHWYASRKYISRQLSIWKKAGTNIYWIAAAILSIFNITRPDITQTCIHDDSDETKSTIERKKYFLHFKGEVSVVWLLRVSGKHKREIARTRCTHLLTGQNGTMSSLSHCKSFTDRYYSCSALDKQMYFNVTRIYKYTDTTVAADHC